VTRSGRGAAILTLSLLSAALGCGTHVSDTGYTGVWQGVEGSGSTISLKSVDGQFVLSWLANDIGREIQCDGRGLCSESKDGALVYKYEFQSLPMIVGEPLRIRCIGTSVDPRAAGMNLIDEFRLGDDGLTLEVYTIERAGETLRPPTGPRRYRKLSNRPS